MTWTAIALPILTFVVGYAAGVQGEWRRVNRRRTWW